MLPTLTDDLGFPPVHRAQDGLLAMGGDLRSERILRAYAQGIFPWYGDNSPILWWSPNPRFVLPLHQFKISNRLRRKIKNGPFHCTINQAFDTVIERCANIVRHGQDGTWLVPAMQEAYKKLNRLGFAHSVECWKGRELAGGVYGVCLGKVFFGESMFHHVSDASKIALSYLVELLKKQKFQLFDCQQDTPHMQKMGACDISRTNFLYLLGQALSACNIDVSKFDSYVSGLTVE